jgi:hypothetical protein
MSRIIPKKVTVEKSMEISFFALPSKQGLVQGRFKLAHDSAELVAGLPITLSTKVAACVRRFETPTALNDGRTESKKDISMLIRAFILGITLKRHSASSSWPRGTVGVRC